MLNYHWHDFPHFHFHRSSFFLNFSGPFNLQNFIDILFLHFILFIQEKVPESEERIYPSPGNLQDEMPAAGIFEGKLA